MISHTTLVYNVKVDSLDTLMKIEKEIEQILKQEGVLESQRAPSENFRPDNFTDEWSASTL